MSWVFLKTVNGEQRLTNAAVLLFAKDIQALYPNCRVRFIRYDGTTAGVGTSINITKDVSIEYSLLRLIDKAREFIAIQLREFTKLNPKTGKFDVIPEYPEFPWLEGLTNAICHREYAMTGAFIKVCMFDDRLEISSPGQLPDVVTLENIRETRFRQSDTVARVVGQEKWEKLDELERRIMAFLSAHGAQSTSQLVQKLEKSEASVRRRINHLLKLNLLTANGNSHDPTRTYQLSV